MLYCAFDMTAIEKGMLSERRMSICKNGMEGVLYELKSPDGISFGYYQLSAGDTGEIVIETRTPFLHFTFNIQGSKRYYCNTAEEHLLDFHSNQCNSLYLNQQTIKLKWRPDEILETFEIGISLKLLHELLPPEHSLHAKLAGIMHADLAVPMTPFNLPLTAQIRQILYDITHCQLTPVFKQMYIKGKMIELLALQAAQYEEVPLSGHFLKKTEIEKMHQVKDIIHSRYDQPCSLIDLAHRVGTNETYLKQHFKKVFGDTVFGYMQQIKMTKARDMLRDGKSVQEVAGKMGYKHPAHFTRAFKKYVGYQPKKIKQSDLLFVQA